MNETIEYIKDIKRQLIACHYANESFINFEIEEKELIERLNLNLAYIKSGLEKIEKNLEVCKCLKNSKKNIKKK